MEENKYYLVRNCSSIFKIKIERITKKCYQISYENNTKSWELIDMFRSKFDIIEDLGLND